MPTKVDAAIVHLEKVCQLRALDALSKAIDPAKVHRAAGEFNELAERRVDHAWKRFEQAVRG